MPKAEEALEAAPGVLAAEVDFESGQATIGTEKGKPVPKDEILAALKNLKYRGTFVEQPLDKSSHR